MNEDGVPGIVSARAASRTITPGSDAKRVDRTVPKESTVPDVSASGGAEAALSKFLVLHPFAQFFQHLADSQFSSQMRPETRFLKLREQDKRLYWLCVVLDLVLTVVAVSILTAGAAYALYKTVVL